MATSWSTEGESEVPIAQHLEVHRRQQRLVGAHDRITDGPGPRSNAMHTATATGIAFAALVRLACAESGRSRAASENAVFGATGEPAEAV